MKNESIRFEVRFDGPALSSGTMDVRDLAPSLLAVAGAIQSANRVLNGEDSQIQVRVRSEFQRGSFGVDLETSHTILQTLRVLVQSETYKTAKEILEMLFGSKIIDAGILGGVILLVRLLRGKKPEAEKRLPSGDVELKVGNTTYTVNGNVYNVYNDAGTRTELARMVGPLGRDGIDSLTVTTPSTDTPVTIDKTDLPYFLEGVTPPGGLESEGVSDRLLSIVGLSFKDGNKWRFTDGENNIISAVITDEDFLKRVHRRDISFGDGDCLSVQLAWKATRGERGLQTVYEIRKVHDIFPRGTQLPLPYGEPDAEPGED